MDCPRCAMALDEWTARKAGPVIVDWCRKCGGVWFGPGELKEVDWEGWTNIVMPSRYDIAEDSGRAIDCPDCSEALEPRKLRQKEDVIVDFCTACGGIWFDANEAKTVIALGEHQRDYVAASRHGPAWDDEYVDDILRGMRAVSRILNS